MPLKGIIDIDSEKTKLSKQKQELEGWIKGARAKLANDKFTSKAPPQVVDEVKAQLASMEEKLKTVEENICNLS